MTITVALSFHQEPDVLRSCVARRLVNCCFPKVNVARTIRVMSLIKASLACSMLIAAAAVFAIALGNEQTPAPNMQLCKHQYALCTSALCVPQPGDPTKAICFCDVQDGASMASVPCNTIQPSTDANGIRTVYSAFSLEQFKQGRKFFVAPTVLPGLGASISVALSIHPTPKKRSVSATYCELKNGLRWAAIATPALARPGIGPAQR